MRAIDGSVNEYMSSQGKGEDHSLDIIKEASNRVIEGTKFSEVDNELHSLYNNIIKNNTLHTYENKLDLMTTPFRTFQNDLQTKGKKMWVETLSIMLKR